MVRPGSARERLSGVLRAAFAEGLLSEQTLSYRLGLVFGPRLIEPTRVIGDLSLRGRRGRVAREAITSAWSAVRRGVAGLAGTRPPGLAPLVLALDWSGPAQDLVIGRGQSCDIALANITVSRRHAKLIFRDGTWIVHDLASRNGLTVNGMRVGRCQLRPGDQLGVGLQLVEID
ncbi:MAG TPA: FHA domain-containing protein [Solirubrobacteraceae bacterium]